MRLARRGLAALGIDGAVAATLLARGWPVLAGAVTIWMIGRHLTPGQQGYYFTFTSMIGLQVIVELGLGYVVVQIASHEMAALAWTVDGRVEGDPRAKGRLQSLLRFALVWFGLAGVLMCAVLVPLGAAFLSLDTAAGGSQDAVPAWSWLVPLTAGQMVLAAVLCLLEGAGRVAHASTTRLAQAVAGSLALWWGLAAGHGLFALVAQAAVVLLVGMAWLLALHRPFFLDLLASARSLPGLAWRREIWPFQWRIAVSWGSGYLIGQLFTPMLFVSAGPVAAGQLGLSLQISTALNLLALAWISAEVPTYGRLMARGEGAAAEKLFLRSLLLSGAVLALLVGGVLLLAFALARGGPPLMERVVPWPLAAWLGIVTLANHVVFSQAALLRARREDPFMALSVMHGLATVVLSLLWIPAHGIGGAVAAHATAALLLALPAGTVIYLRKRRHWHGAAAPYPGRSAT